MWIRDHGQICSKENVSLMKIEYTTEYLKNVLFQLEKYFLQWIIIMIFIYTGEFLYIFRMFCLFFFCVFFVVWRWAMKSFLRWIYDAQRCCNIKNSHILSCDTFFWITTSTCVWNIFTVRRISCERCEWILSSKVSIQLLFF